MSVASYNLVDVLAVFQAAEHFLSGVFTVYHAVIQRVSIFLLAEVLLGKSFAAEVENLERKRVKPVLVDV